MIADERRRMADLVESLSAEQLRAPSLCGAWTVKEVFGHLVAAVAVGTGAALRALAVSGFRLHRANARLAAAMAERPAGDLAGLLRAHAEDPFQPPVVGFPGQLTDLQVHGLDVRRPLGLAGGLRPERVAVSLDFLVGGRAVGFVPRGRPAGLRFEAADVEWSWGSGPVVRGSGEALLLGLTGRRVAFAELSGDGVATLAARR